MLIKFKDNTMGTECQHSKTQNGVDKVKSVWKSDVLKAEIIRHPNTGCRTTSQVC